MKSRKRVKLLLVVCLFVLNGVSFSNAASVLVDYSPGRYGVSSIHNYYGNQSNIQNFGEYIVFNSDVTISGMDIWTRKYPVYPDALATVRFWNDSDGEPDTVFSTFKGAFSIFDHEESGNLSSVRRLHMAFSNHVLLSADTPYWVGMSGGKDMGLITLAEQPSTGDSNIACFRRTSFKGFLDHGDMAFRLYGERLTNGSQVPVPPSVFLLVFGLWGLWGFAGSGRVHGHAGRGRRFPK